MSVHSGPDISNDGLVFAYDMSNTQKSWKGAPVVNLALNTDYSNSNYDTVYDIGGFGGDDADVIYYRSGGYNNLPYKKMIKHTGGTGGSFITEHGPFTLVEGTTYIITCYMKSNIPTTVSGHTLALNRNSDNAYRVPADIALTTEWVKQSWTYTCAVGEGGTTYQFRQIVYNDTSLPVEVYWSGLQISAGTISYPYVNGTRSNTQAVLDLTNNNTVTATSLTYASDSTFSFNGSNSLTVPYNPSLFTFNNEQTIIIWMKNEASVAARRNPYNQAFGGGGTITHENNTNFNYIYGTSGVNNVPYYAHGSPFSVVLNETAQIAITRNVSQTAWYKNGALGNTLANPYGSTVVTGTSPILIGTGYTNGVVGGLYAVQIYNRALTALEIQQNFNATRGRYGI